MKIANKIYKSQEEGRVFFSFEFFPPKTDAGVQNLFDRIDRMAQLQPLFCDITWGAGGSTATLTMEIAKNMVNFCCVETMMHLTCTNQTVDEVKKALDDAKEAGITNILALRGDPPHGKDEWEQIEGGFAHAVDLVRYIRKNYGDYFGIAVAGYPEGHMDAPSYEEDLQHLKEKVDAGADMIITQLFYDVTLFIKFVDDCRALGIHVPIIPGIMPIHNYNSFVRMTTFCKTFIPQEIKDRLEPIKDNDEAVKAYGVELAIDMCRKLIDAGVPGVHLYSLNLEKSVCEIIDGLGLAKDAHLRKQLPWRRVQTGKRVHEDVRPIFWAHRPKSYLSRTAQWDEYPNGRWGDSNSPAFGEITDVFHGMPGPFSHANKAQLLGEAPSSEEEVFDIFVKYCEGKISALPWCYSGLAPESISIQDKLIRLNRNGFLTINSQPRVNGQPSDDPFVGWGGPDGVVFQKAYIEFFVSPERFAKLREAMSEHPSLVYHGVNVKGESFSNGPEKSTTAVTWGVFANREIIQPTVVDSEAFHAWKDEAMQLWLDVWATTYEKGSPSHALIEKIHNTYFLVNIVDNNFVDGDIYSVFEDTIEALHTDKMQQ